jgi:hypothetical protein
MWAAFENAVSRQVNIATCGEPDPEAEQDVAGSRSRFYFATLKLLLLPFLTRWCDANSRFPRVRSRRDAESSDAFLCLLGRTRRIDWLA